MKGRFGLVAVATAMACSTFAATRARAESGDFNLHIEPGLAIPLAGEAVPDGGGSVPIGVTGMLSFDWQLATPLAIEVIAGGGYFIPPAPVEMGGVTVEYEGFETISFGAGVRYRFMDNQEGYMDEEGGDILGNFWASAHLGVHKFDGWQFGIDAALGYEWSVMRPIQLGVFARGHLFVGGDTRRVEDAGPPIQFADSSEMDFTVTFGVSASIAFGEAEILDTDGDSLADEREINQHQTDPNNPDTDGDTLNDGLEVRTETNPRNPDTDGDELTDGAEDANQSGGLDAGESDPRDNDSDDGGVPDGWERAHPPHDPRNAADDDSDRDRVLDNVDQCPDTPQGVEVDPRGCTILRATMVLAGINFEFNSDQITANSEVQLQTAAQLLRDNPTATVEIGGHTDNVGSATYNRDLSARRAASVKNWLVAHGIDAARMTTRGYGSTRPAATNDTEEGRAQNRRIEFRRTDAGAAEEGQPVRREP